MDLQINKHNLISQYAPLLTSAKRNLWYKQAIQRSCKDKIVMDMGTGTGLLANYALEAGAKFVYCIEAEPTAARLANGILAECHDRSRFKVINHHFDDPEITTLIPPGSIDVFVTETISWSMFDDGILEIWQRAKQLMHAGSVAIPNRITADAYVYDTIIEPQVPFHDLDERTVFSRRYFAALEKYNQLEYPYTIKKFVDDLPEHQSIIPGLFDVSYSDQLKPVEFTLELSKPSDVAIIGYIHSDQLSVPLNMPECNTTGWGIVPVIRITKSGSTKIRYQHDAFNNNHWLRITE